MSLPFGIDISKYQASGDMKQLPDWAKMRANTDFVALRAGISWGYEDPLFSTGWNALQAHCRMAYHVLYPSQDGVRQADWFWNIVSTAGFDAAHDRLVVDLELDQNYTKAQITTTLLAFMARILYLSGRYPLIYSRASWINAHVDVSRLPASTDWWLAHYLAAKPSPAYTPEKPSPPALPKGVSNWLIHQTGERGNGSAVGVVSYYVDTNRWNGTLEEMRAYFGYGASEPEPVPEPEKLFDAKVCAWATPYVNIRKEPSIASADLGDIYPNTTVAVLEVVGNWYRISRGYVMSKYLQRLDYEVPPVYIPIAPLWQRDPRWKGVKLGNSNLTIGSDGCLVTCIAELAGVTPDICNSRLKTVGGFTGALVYWQMVPVAYPKLEYLRAIDCYWVAAPLDVIDNYLAQGVTVLVHVDLLIETATVEQHWVHIKGKRGNDYIVNDPWQGDECMFTDRFGDPALNIYRIRVYRRK